MYLCISNFIKVIFIITITNTDVHSFGQDPVLFCCGLQYQDDCRNHMIIVSFDD